MSTVRRLRWMFGSSQAAAISCWRLWARATAFEENLQKTIFEGRQVQLLVEGIHAMRDAVH